MAKKIGPTKEEVLAARLEAGHTQEEAAEAAELSSFTRWSEYERGKRNMEQARFELYKIKAGLHPDYGPKRRVTKHAVKSCAER